MGAFDYTQVWTRTRLQCNGTRIKLGRSAIESMATGRGRALVERSQPHLIFGNLRKLSYFDHDHDGQPVYYQHSSAAAKAVCNRAPYLYDLCTKGNTSLVYTIAVLSSYSERFTAGSNIVFTLSPKERKSHLQLTLELVIALYLCTRKIRKGCSYRLFSRQIVLFICPVDLCQLICEQPRCKLTTEVAISCSEFIPK
ncbi:uncharacterized protein BT62DRAFT_1075664 [Guyanagaster necrorhizus]|uniref:Uncharacterized protein n=1 Tax=Guyanagaster necrorhizus TaxID=856835 RepID=A0A9P7VW15_9AGAR|nr:uncharacterized protein BT62DRAFT_1075664 [Guyanagaster necrorhizus MCA 3950]KAG7446921.1 hypothetical protein BT62DRAFT_1075664 [Guyanagaster necrorhizus MCA 3950]